MSKVMNTGIVGQPFDKPLGFKIKPKQKKRNWLECDFVNGKPGLYQRLRRWFK